MSHSPKNRRAFTLVELLTVIAIIGILAAMLVPAVNAVRGSVEVATCASHLREIYKGYQMFAAEHNDRVISPFRFEHYADIGLNPYANQESHMNCFFHWQMILTTLGYLGMPDLPHRTFKIREVNSSGFLRYNDNAAKCFSVLGCPTVQRYDIEHNGGVYDADAKQVIPGGRDGMRNYCANKNFGYSATNYADQFFYFNQFAAPSRTCLLGDWRKDQSHGNDYIQINLNGTTLFPEAIHGNGANLLFADGHIECLDVDTQIPKRGAENWQIFWKGVY